MNPITEEQLMAYADGELDQATAQQVRAAIEADPALARRLDQHQQLRRRMQAAHQPMLDEPVPEPLQRAAMQAPAAATVIDLAARRAERIAPPAATARGPRQRSWARWGGIAAGVLVGLVVAQMLGIGNSDDQFATTSRGLMARGAIGNALSNRLASTNASGDQISLQISFVDSTGRYCRTFTTPTIAGLACRDGDDWAVQSLLQTAGSGQTEMRPASSSLPPELLQMVDQQMRGGALDAQAEQAALDRQWQR